MGQKIDSSSPPTLPSSLKSHSYSQNSLLILSIALAIIGATALALFGAPQLLPALQNFHWALLATGIFALHLAPLVLLLAYYSGFSPSSPSLKSRPSPAYTTRIILPSVTAQKLPATSPLLDTLPTALHLPPTMSLSQQLAAHASYPASHPASRSALATNASTYSLQTTHNINLYHYHCDAIKDQNWGSTWRSLQMLCANIFDTHFNFETLYTSCDAFYKFKKSWSDLRRTQWLEGERAEPGYVRTFLMQHGIPSNIYFYHCKGTEKTPKLKEDFHITEDDFSALIEAMHAHFREQSTPIMADDILYAYTIYGVETFYKSGGETVHILLIADPQTFKTEEVIYAVKLNAEGQLLSIGDFDVDTKTYTPIKHPLSTARQLFFKDKLGVNKRWMFLFPSKKADFLKESA